jgi:hypothetical protein
MVEVYGTGRKGTFRRFTELAVTKFTTRVSFLFMGALLQTTRSHRWTRKTCGISIDFVFLKFPSDFCVISLSLAFHV